MFYPPPFIYNFLFFVITPKNQKWTNIEGLLRVLEYTSDVYTTPSRHASTPTTVAVIDGPKLLLTPFRDANVPPPMSATTLDLPCAVASVALGNVPASLPSTAGVPSGDVKEYQLGDDLAVILSDFSIWIAKSTGPLKPHVMLGKLRYHFAPNPFVYTNHLS